MAKDWIYGTLSVIGCIVATVPATAVGPTRDPNAAALPEILVWKLQKYEEQYLSRLLQPLRYGGEGGLYIDQATLDRFASSYRAATRASKLLQQMGADTDGDGKLTRHEVEKAVYQTVGSRRDNETAIAYDQRLQRAIDEKFAKDINGDGVVSMDEVYSWADTKARKEYKYDPGYRDLSQLLALDPNGDGKLTAAELEKLGKKAFRVFDRDKNGVLNQQEFQALLAEKQARVAKRKPLSPDGS